MNYSKTQLAVADVLLSIFMGEGGLTLVQAAGGLIPQADAESSFRVDVWGDKRPDGNKDKEAYGLFQLHGDRRTVIHSHSGIDMMAPDAATQARGVIWELKHVETAAYSALLKITDPYQAGFEMCKLYERAGAAGAEEKRGNLGRQWFAHYSA